MKVATSVTRSKLRYIDPSPRTWTPDDFDEVFYQVFDPISRKPYWISSYGERKSPEDMASYLNKELCGEFKITQF